MLHLFVPIAAGPSHASHRDDLFFWQYQISHVITVPFGTTEVVLPEPPSGVTHESIYAATSLGAIQLCSREEWSRDFCTRFARSETFYFEP